MNFGAKGVDGERAIAHSVRMRTLLVVAALLAAPCLVAQTPRDERWRADLDFLVTTLQARHPNLYTRVPAAQWDEAVAGLRERIPGMTDTLVAMDWDGKTAIPYLAKSWTISPDGKLYTFKLRDDVSFCSGKKFTAEDVIYSFKRLKSPELKAPLAWRAGNIKELRAPDPYTVEYELNEPFADLLLLKDRLAMSERFKVMRMLFGGHVDRYDYHVTGLNEEFIAYFLREAGFADVQRVADLGFFDDTSRQTFHGMPISLNVTARKAR